MVKILGVNGAIRPGSTADRALQFTLARLAELGAECSTFDIGQLPLLDGRPPEQYPGAVAAWQAACREADGLVVAVPSYHGAMPGGLKNALDFVDAPEAGGKPFLVLAIAGGDAEPAGTDVTRVMRHIGGIAGGPEVAISRAGERWGKGAEPADDGVGELIRRAAAALLALARLRAEGKLPEP
ncbi:MAG: FMN reductase [Tepidiforma sp.]|nr:MAG: FMN reductase [Tepidiforma sp.]